MSDSEIDKLLDLASECLTEKENSLSTVEEISESWKSLPKIDSELLNEESIAQRRTKVLGVTKLAREGEEKQKRKLRLINDPVRVRLDAKAEKEAHAGDEWFNMPKTDVTPSIKRDLQMLKMRAVLDPKRHYKKDNSGPPKYFQTGTIVEGNTEYFSSRLTKKERKQTLADEILADQNSQQYFKRKYSEIQIQKTSGRKRHYKKVQQMRKKL